FAFADVEDVGTRMLVVADGDIHKAERLAAELGQELFANRARFAGSFLSIDAALERVRAHTDGTVVIADRADKPGSGAPGDSTFVLRRVRETKTGPALLGVMWDPVAVRIAEDAGIGSTLDLRIGGKSGMVSGDPVDLRVTVRNVLHDGHQPFGP